jgi:hypothetical protein
MPPGRPYREEYLPKRLAGRAVVSVFFKRKGRKARRQTGQKQPAIRRVFGCTNSPTRVHHRQSAAPGVLR